MLVFDVFVIIGYCFGIGLVLLIASFVSLFVTVVVGKRMGWIMRQEVDPDEDLIHEVEFGSGVPDAVSTKRLFVLLRSGNTAVFTSWLRGEAYSQSRETRKMTHAEALDVAMTPEISDAECEVKRT